MNKIQALPLGISSFKSLRENDYLYIDKTKLLLDLVRGTRYNFLSRPRRFGKSLLVSTLKELFSGNRDLFKGLWIDTDSDYQWPVHPVVYIDINRVDKGSPEILEDGLRYLMTKIGKSYGIDLSSARSSGQKLIDLVEQLSPRGQVVILIDEYDQPITAALHDMDLAQANRAVLKEFYSKIKSLDEHMRFLFITGVSRFTKTSLFSDLNNVKDLSLAPSVAAVLGYTKEEIEKYLPRYIESFAQAKKLSIEVIYQEMRDWYNGYRFSRDEVTVYNPWSVLNYLDSQECSNYWFTSSTPRFLMAMLKANNHYSFKDLEKMSASEELLNTFDIPTIPLVTLLYQTGYMTIKSYNENTNMYELTYPNKEVEVSLAGHLLGAFLDKGIAEIETSATGLREALFAADMERFAYSLQILFAGIPYVMHKEQESYYHSLLHVACAILGSDVSSEVMTSVGRIDLVVILPEVIFVIELKLDKTAQEALTQVKERRYAEKYLPRGKKIMLVGLNFEYATKTVTAVSEWL